MERRLQISPNTFGGRQGGKEGTRYGGGSLGTEVPKLKKVFKMGVGKDIVKKPIEPIKKLSEKVRPVVKGKETGANVVKQAKKYWMWIVGAIIAYFVLKRK